MISISLQEMSDRQLFGFCQAVFADDDGYCPPFYEWRDVAKWLSSSKVFTEREELIGYLFKRFPGLHNFEEDVYIPCLLRFEEENHREEKIGKGLPLLGSCEIYPSLKRIVYVDPCIYAEDYDTPSIPHPEIKRMSFEKYFVLLEEERKKIVECQDFIEKIMR